MLKDIAQKYYKEGYNCAEAIIRGGNDYYNLGLNDHDMKMTAAFGAGLQVGDVCGALTSSACVISSKYIEVKAHDQAKELQQITVKLVLAFQERLGSRLCAKIKPVYHNKEIRCENTVMIACDVLQEVISQWDNKDS